MTDIEKILSEIERLLKHAAFNNGDVEHGYDLALLDVKRFVNSTIEEPISDDLEEAAHQYAWDKQEHHVDFNGDEYLDYGVRFDSFKAGAQWHEEQMMSKAIDGEVGYWNLHGLSVNVELPSTVEEGDKVKVIVIKED